ncbi:3-hydroxyacyl-ACP dehydratase FabZ family protein [Limosilactobacillus reuteri]|uniref:3-hydroxyacyl-ACP dehydratase FabZ family protein n=1 Tax=Limosilactobacillus reuteri TaxID=1598 RepID=UPI001E29F136|nr:hypothetical protein [Limosilactobacillus reuteri]
MLPQKEPFRFLDTVECFDREKRMITALQQFGNEEFFFKGHFPNNPIVPGVLLTESIAQAGLILISLLEGQKVKIGYLAQIEKTKFFKEVYPDEQVKVKCSLKKKIGKYYYIAGEVYSQQLNKRCMRATVIVCI